MKTDNTKRALTIRLNRMVGQLNGIKKMIAEDSACEDVLTQIGAVSGALHNLSFLVLDKHVRRCAQEDFTNDKTRKIATSLIESVQRFSARASFQRNAGLFAIAREGCLSGLQRES